MKCCHERKGLFQDLILSSMERVMKQSEQPTPLHFTSLDVTFANLWIRLIRDNDVLSSKVL